MAGEVVLLESGGSEGGFGVKEAGEGGDDVFALRIEFQNQPSPFRR